MPTRPPGHNHGSPGLRSRPPVNVWGSPKGSIRGGHWAFPKLSRRAPSFLSLVSSDTSFMMGTCLRPRRASAYWQLPLSAPPPSTDAPAPYLACIWHMSRFCRCAGRNNDNSLGPACSSRRHGKRNGNRHLNNAWYSTTFVCVSQRSMPGKSYFR